MSATRARVARGTAADRRGRMAEHLCVVRLWLTGWQVLARRRALAKGTGAGEIDIIARRGATLAFIEVKARDGEAAALESVTAAQRARRARGAEVFLSRRPDLAACNVRFDVMTLSGLFWPRRVADAWRP